MPALLRISLCCWNILTLMMKGQGNSPSAGLGRKVLWAWSNICFCSSPSSFCNKVAMKSIGRVPSDPLGIPITGTLFSLEHASRFSYFFGRESTTPVSEETLASKLVDMLLWSLAMLSRAIIAWPCSTTLASSEARAKVVSPLL